MAMHNHRVTKRDETITDWRTQAACTSDPDKFSIDSELSVKQQERDIAVAKAICATCPVVAECASWAIHLKDGLVDMVAGGMSPTELDAMRGPTRYTTRLEKVEAIAQQPFDAGYRSERVREYRNNAGSRTPIPVSLVVEYLNLQYSSAQIAKKLGCDIRSIARLRKTLNLNDPKVRAGGWRQE